MYFTKFPINRTRRDSKRMLGSPYVLHAAIAGSFPPSEAGENGSAGRVLWRVDAQPSGEMTLYLVSPQVPSLIGLDEQIGWPDRERQWQTKDYDPFLARIEDGQNYQFRLVANPVLNPKEVVSEKGVTKRVGHLTALQQTAWLIGAQAYDASGHEVPDRFERNGETRASRNGFRVLSDADSGAPRIVVSDIRKRTFPRGHGGAPITIASARFDGVLQVINADALRGALSKGIGHAKGFGCGLLTIVPLS
ncbi:MAG: type I-E CRISPR-associated protein Cas6/Cse3/CasE [Olsenella sp.]